ncbi:ABC transporter ATP-binding protein [Nonomuraea typhae]|uniref:ABC transporter ATP-binding protein n=1 Tax=Nonomuraea typhae TaxID=2603600 RepID=UPI001FEB0ACC|nr:ATP-binding cassette domain-containing protein [Nonomuraea typhae]
MTPIHARGVRKHFPGNERPALDGVDLTVGTGRVCALLGGNGAGKTTMVRIMTTLTRADAGTVHIAGHDVRTEGTRVRAAIGLVGQYAALDEVLSARENLELFARLSGLGRRRARERAEELLGTAGLTGTGRRPVGAFSGGMRRRLDLATSLITTPGVLFIDEPTTGLDPQARRELWASVTSLARSGTTVLLTTQYLDEADALADDVVILREGRVIAQGTPQDLKKLVGEPRMELREPTLEDVYLHLHTENPHTENPHTENPHTEGGRVA